MITEEENAKLSVKWYYVFRELRKHFWISSSLHPVPQLLLELVLPASIVTLLEGRMAIGFED